MVSFDNLPCYLQHDILLYFTLSAKETPRVCKQWRKLLSNYLKIKSWDTFDFTNSDSADALHLSKFSNSTQKIYLKTSIDIIEKCTPQFKQLFPSLLPGQSTVYMIFATRQNDIWIQKISAISFTVSIKRLEIDNETERRNNNIHRILDLFPNLTELCLNKTDPYQFLSHPIISQLDSLEIYHSLPSSKSKKGIILPKSLKKLQLYKAGSIKEQILMKIIKDDLEVLIVDSDTQLFQKHNSNCPQLRTFAVSQKITQMQTFSFQYISENMKYLQKLCYYDEDDCNEGVSTILQNCRYLTCLMLKTSHPIKISIFNTGYYLQTIIIDYNPHCCDSHIPFISLDDVINLCLSCPYLKELHHSYYVPNYQIQEDYQSQINKLMFPRTIELDVYLVNDRHWRKFNPCRYQDIIHEPLPVG